MSRLGFLVEYDPSKPMSALDAFTVTLRNTDVIPMAAKLVTQHRDWYIVTPPRVFVAPRSTASINITLQPPDEHAEEECTDDRPLSDILRVEVRALVSVPSSTVRSISIADFTDHWKRAVPQDSHTVEAKLQWMTRADYVARLTEMELSKHAVLRSRLQQETLDMQAAERRIEALRSRAAGYEEDMLDALQRLNATRSAVGVHWIVFIIAVVTSLAAAADWEDYRLLRTDGWGWYGFSSIVE